VAGTVPIKTPEGQAELSARQRRVSQRHRTVLFLIDGKRSADEVQAMALKAGVPDSCFSDLLDLGLIMLPEPGAASARDSLEAEPGVAHVDLPLPGPDSVSPVSPSEFAALPPSQSLFPESASADSTLGSVSTAQAWLNADSIAAAGASDSAFVEARLILVRAVRAQAPLAGTITLLKLRRARTREDLNQLLDEVESRITKPRRSLAATHTMRRVRQLLDGRIDSSLESA